MVATIYNFSWIINNTSVELDLNHLLLRGSFQAYAGGFVLLFGFFSSIYHLMYMGLLRVYALKRPLQYKFMASSKVIQHLTIVWMICIIPAAIPRKCKLLSLWLISGFQKVLENEEFRANSTVDSHSIVTLIIKTYKSQQFVSPFYLLLFFIARFSVRVAEAAARNEAATLHRLLSYPLIRLDEVPSDSTQGPRSSSRSSNRSFPICLGKQSLFGESFLRHSAFAILHQGVLCFKFTVF